MLSRCPVMLHLQAFFIISKPPSALPVILASLTFPRFQRKAGGRTRQGWVHFLQSVLAADSSMIVVLDHALHHIKEELAFSCFLTA